MAAKRRTKRSGSGGIAAALVKEVAHRGTSLTSWLRKRGKSSALLRFRPPKDGFDPLR